jgi:CBS domain-containing protein
MASHNNPVFAFLHEKKLGEVCDTSTVVTVKSSGTVEDAIKVLTENKVLSAPVVNDKGESVGMIDMLDIVSAITKVKPDPVDLLENELRSLEISGRAMAFESVEKVVGLSGRDPLFPVNENAPASEVVDFFAKGIHRTPVFHATESKIVGSCSQSTLIKLLSENLHMGNIKVIGAKTAKELGLGAAKPITVNKNDNVLKVLDTLQKNSISAVALVEDDGKLAGNFSASDLAGLYKEHFPSFLLPAFEFLNKHSPASLNSVCCTLDTTLLDITKELTSNKTHRLWVVDGDFKPIGVVSTTDIFKVVRDYQYA